MPPTPAPRPAPPADARDPRASASPIADERDAPAPFYRQARLVVVPRAARAASTGATDGASAMAMDGEDPVIELSFSSEEPVERWDWMTGKSYLEVLGHAKGEVDLSYASDGLPCLRSHDSWNPDRHVGICEAVTIADGQLRGTVRFSQNPPGRAALRDVIDGILKKVSVGYDFPVEIYDQTEAKGQATRRYRGWRPLEMSMVPIPADYSVGVGRHMRPGMHRSPVVQDTTAPVAEERVMPPEVESAAPAAVVVAGVNAGVNSDHREIAAIAKQHKMSDRLADWIGNGATLAQVREEILKHYREKSEATLTRGGGDGVVQLTDREEKRFSVARAIQGIINGRRAGFEFEVSDEIEKRLKRNLSSQNAFYLPTNLRTWGDPIAAAQRATLAVSASASGQELKFTEYGGFLPMLRNRSRVLALGATILGGLQGDVSFVTQPSAGTFAWGAETGTTSNANFGTGIRTMSPKNGSAAETYTRQLLAQSVESIEGLVRDDLTKIVAIGLDLGAIAGSGAANNPRGVLNTTGIGSVAMGTNGAAMTSATYGKIVDLETAIVNANADLGTMGYLTTPTQGGTMKQTQQFTATNGLVMWGGTLNDGILNGYKATTSKQVPATLTKGTSTGICSALIFGEWSTLLIGEWGASEVIVDPYTLAPQQIRLSTLVLADVFLRYVESFAAIQDIL